MTKETSSVGVGMNYGRSRHCNTPSISFDQQEPLMNGMFHRLRMQLLLFKMASIRVLFFRINFLVKPTLLNLHFPQLHPR